MGKTEYRELYDYVGRLGGERRKGLHELGNLLE